MRNYGGQAMNRIYETKDGQYIALAGNERKFCENFLAALGRTDLIDLAAGEPGDSQKPLIEFFAATFNAKTRAEWEVFLSPIDLCWGTVRSLKDGFNDPNSSARGMLLRDANGNPHIGPAIKYANEAAEPRFNLPDYGRPAKVDWMPRRA
jgi:crotonobetainyl-CoA:carnitine CoA-transferase CaiB-like acyl-CoA transferase